MASCSAVLVLQSRFFDDSMIIFRSVGLHKTSVPAVHGACQIAIKVYTPGRGVEATLHALHILKPCALMVWPRCSVRT